jgi:hypothetical protein
MKTLFDAYKDKAIVLVVYIREAHPAGEEQTSEDAGWKAIDETVFHQPKSFEERRKLAETACTFWDLPVPTLVDTMKPSAGEMYQASPNRLYLIDREGKIAYRDVRGPRGCKVHEGELALRKLLGITDGDPVTEKHENLFKPRSKDRPKDENGSKKDGPKKDAPKKEIR